MNRQQTTTRNTRIRALRWRRARSLIALLCLALWLGTTPLLFAAPVDDVTITSAESIDGSSVNWNEAIE